MNFGIAAEDFYASFFEKNTYLRRGALQTPAFNWAQLDETLYRIEPREPGVALYRNGPVPLAQYTESTIEFGAPRLRFSKARFYQQLTDGATLVINRIENHVPVVRRLCIAVARFAGQQTISNSYLSFRGDGTFGKHWDTHDVFAIQLLGRKRWQVFKPTFPLPLSHHKSDGRSAECSATPVLDCVLEAGDLLYIPRGWWHQAIPLECASFHVSVGSYAATLYDYMMWCCARRLAGEVDARRALASGVDARVLTDLMQQLGASVLDPAAIAEFARDIQSRERAAAEFNMDLELNRNDAPLATNRAVLMNGNCYHVQDGHVLINGERVGVDETTAALLQVMNATGTATIAELEQQLAPVSPTTLHAALRELSRRNIVTITQ